jgi:hypothetical protein
MKKGKRSKKRETRNDHHYEEVGGVTAGYDKLEELLAARMTGQEK